MGRGERFESISLTPNLHHRLKYCPQYLNKAQRRKIQTAKWAAVGGDGNASIRIRKYDKRNQKKKKKKKKKKNSSRTTSNHNTRTLKVLDFQREELYKEYTVLGPGSNYSWRGSLIRVYTLLFSVPILSTYPKVEKNTSLTFTATGNNNIFLQTT